MRPGEVLGLRRPDVDLFATFVDRRGGAERVRGNGLIVLRDTKNGRERITPLSEPARMLIAFLESLPSGPPAAPANFKLKIAK
jgi:integrase